MHKSLWLLKPAKLLKLPKPPRLPKLPRLRSSRSTRSTRSTRSIRKTRKTRIQISEEEAVDQAIDEAIRGPENKWSGDTTKVIGKVEVIESPDKTRVTLGSNEVIIVEENGDSVIVGLGNKGISIVEDGDGVRINVLDMDEEKNKNLTRKNSMPTGPVWKWD